MNTFMHFCFILAIVVDCIALGSDANTRTKTYQRDSKVEKCGDNIFCSSERAKRGGECGIGLVWSLENGTLTVEGMGEMYNFTDGIYQTQPPWYSQRKDITRIDIKEGVTSIGNFAFYKCEQSTQITIPSSVISLGEHSFDGCSALTSVTIPSSVTSIGIWVFVNCKILKSIDVESGNRNYRSDDGVLIDIVSHSLVQYPMGKTETHYTIPNDIVSIEYAAFISCPSLVDVTIPESVETIGNSAFFNCVGLTSLIIPSSVKTIEKQAFSQCQRLVSVVIPESVTSIADDSFRSCPSLALLFYQGTNDFLICEKLQGIQDTKVCVSPGYELNTFCGKNVTSPSSFKTCEEFQAKFNQCRMGSYKDGGVISVNRPNAIEWEKQTDECFEYKCDNEVGLVKWSVCNRTDSKNLQCVKGQCVDGEEDKLRVEMEIENVKASDVNMTELTNSLLMLTGVKREDITIGIEVDDNGYLLKVIVYVDDEELANIIMNSLKDVKKEGCAYGMLCVVKRVVVKGDKNEISEGDKNPVNKLLLIVVLIFCVLQEVEDLLIW